MDAHFIEGMPIPLLLMDNNKMKKEYIMLKQNQDDSEKKNILKQFLYEHVVDEISDMEEVQEKLDKEFQ